MCRSVFKAALPLLLIAAVVLTPSCIFKPETKDVVDPPDPVEWPDMTDRDDVIETVVLAYKNPKLGESNSRYNGLLHTQYFFKLHDTDVEPGESQIMTRATDIASTEWLFDVHSMLELTITETGTWYEYSEIEGEPCEDCYETTRQYFVRAQLGDETTIYQSPPERAFVTIIVAPDENDSSKWVLRAMFDLGI
jgi:hypothetical protein